MSTPIADTRGRAYALASSTKVGSTLVCGSGFTCLHKWEELTVKANHNGELYVECSAGRHALDGQFQGGVYLGFYPG